eukprot:SAG11_NODE_16445_length_547_cov_0.917411_1_plen_69_part_10
MAEAAVVANLRARFPECTKEQVQTALHKSKNHAGQAGRFLRKQLDEATGASLGNPPRSRLLPGRNPDIS